MEPVLEKAKSFKPGGGVSPDLLSDVFFFPPAAAQLSKSDLGSFVSDGAACQSGVSLHCKHITSYYGWPDAPQPTPHTPQISRPAEQREFAPLSNMNLIRDLQSEDYFL